MFTIDLDNVIVCEMQQLASWCSRYANIVTWLKPFSRELYRSIRGLTNQNMKLNLSTKKEKIQQIVDMWIQQLVSVKLNVREFGRPFNTFKINDPDIVMEFDASLEDFGVGLYDIHTNVLMYGFKFHQVNLFNIKGDSSFQNSMEFIAVVLGIYWVISLSLPYRSFTSSW